MTTSKTPRARITGTLHLPSYYADAPRPWPRADVPTSSTGKSAFIPNFSPGKGKAWTMPHPIPEADPTFGAQYERALDALANRYPGVGLDLLSDVACGVRPLTDVDPTATGE